MADPFDVGDVLMQILEDILLILFSLILGLVVFELNTRVLILIDLKSQKNFIHMRVFRVIGQFFLIRYNNILN